MAKVFEKSKHNSMILSKMKQFQSDRKFWDVQLEVDNRLFKCQRSVLAANSEYFYTMFSSEFEESNTTKDEPISLHQMDSTAFEEMLHFMYTGEIQVDESNVLQLLFMNDFLKLCTGHVKEQCLKHVKSRSQEDEPMSNAIDLLCFAHLKGENVLVRTLHAHIGRHLYHYSKNAQLMETSFKILNSLLEFTKDHILPLRGSADVLLMIVHNWIDHSRAGRSQYYSNLMKYIDFANVSSNFSRSLINRLEYVLNEVVNLSKDTESLPEWKKLIMGIDTNVADGIDQFDKIISFRFEKASQMQSHRPEVFSSSCIISGLSWKIGIGRRFDDISMSLHCDGTNLMPVWSCYASAMFTIVSHKEGRNHFVGNLGLTLFTSSKESDFWGPQVYMEWNYIKDPENGFLGDDDSITISVHVHADLPFLEIN